MGKSRRCTGCRTLLSDHAFGKHGKTCTGPESVAAVSAMADETDPPSRSTQVADGPTESIEATLASLVGAVNSLTTGLQAVQADNQQLRALLTKQSPINDQIPVSSSNAGGAAASGITLPELRAMQDLSQKADQRVAQLGLVESSDSESEHDEVEPSTRVRVSNI